MSTADDNVIKVTQLEEAEDEEGQQLVIDAWPALVKSMSKKTAFAAITYVEEETVDEDDEPFTYRGLDLVLPADADAKEDALMAELKKLAKALLKLAGDSSGLFVIERGDVSVEISDEDGYDADELADLLD